jgi:hypothetical protein
MMSPLRGQSDRSGESEDSKANKDFVHAQLLWTGKKRQSSALNYNCIREFFVPTLAWMLRAVVEGWQRLDQPVPWIVETARFILDGEAVVLGVDGISAARPLR